MRFIWFLYLRSDSVYGFTMNQHCWCVLSILFGCMFYFEFHFFCFNFYLFIFLASFILYFSSVCMPLFDSTAHRIVYFVYMLVELCVELNLLLFTLQAVSICRNRNLHIACNQIKLWIQEWRRIRRRSEKTKKDRLMRISSFHIV